MNLCLSPFAKFKAFYPGSNIPLLGGLLYTAQPGTTVIFGSTPAFPQTTYTDSTGNTSNTNPIILNSSGECDLWLSTFTKLVLYDPLGNLIWSVDNVSSQPATSAAVAQWVTQSTNPIYISATQFSVPGNVVSSYPIGSAIQATLSGGTIIGQITNAAYTSVTTVTVQWASTQLNNTVSVIATGIISGGIPSSLPIMPVRALTTNYTILYTDLFQYFTMNSASATSLILPAANLCPSGAWVKVKNIGTGVLTITGTVDGSANPTLLNLSERTFWTDGTSWYGASGIAASPVAVRQTVLSGPVDANGMSNFGGATGSTTVTMSGSIIVAAANGFSSGIQQDVIGTGSNLAWTGLSTPTTMWMYVTISNGVLTSLVTSLAPVYEWGGTPSVTLGQLTFNIQSMTGYIGNGSSAVQTPWVCVGEVTVGGGVVTAITWYALMGRSLVTQASLSTSSQYSFSDNIGTTMKSVTNAYIVCKVTDQAYALGDKVSLLQAVNLSGSIGSSISITGRNTVNLSTSANGIAEVVKKDGTGTNSVTTADWSFECTIQRNF